VYVALPNSLHAEWTAAAAAAGKHVLCEKPLGASAAEAELMFAAAREHGVWLMEAFMYRFHPRTLALARLVAAGEIGEVRLVRGSFGFTVAGPGNTRLSAELAGGGLMDVGCYGIHLHRMLGRFAGGAPQITGAEGRERAGSPGVDEWVRADLAFPGGATGVLHSSMAASEVRMTARLVGTAGELNAGNFVLPHRDDSVRVTAGGTEREELLGRRPSYAYQLEAFAAAVRDGVPVLTDADDAVATAELLDDCYRAAGFDPRPRSAAVS
jgi:predicted dehydrogenase